MAAVISPPASARSSEPLAPCRDIGFGLMARFADDEDAGLLLFASTPSPLRMSMPRPFHTASTTSEAQLGECQHADCAIKITFDDSRPPFPRSARLPSRKTMISATLHFSFPHCQRLQSHLAPAAARRTPRYAISARSDSRQLPGRAQQQGVIVAARQCYGDGGALLMPMSIRQRYVSAIRLLVAAAARATEIVSHSADRHDAAHEPQDGAECSQ